MDCLEVFYGPITKISRKEKRCNCIVIDEFGNIYSDFRLMLSNELYLPNATEKQVRAFFKSFASNYMDRIKHEAERKHAEELEKFKSLLKEVCYQDF